MSYLCIVVSEVVFAGTCRRNIFYVHKKLFLRVGVKRGTVNNGSGIIPTPTDPEDDQPGD